MDCTDTVVVMDILYQDKTVMNVIVNIIILLYQLSFFYFMKIITGYLNEEKNIS